MSVNPNLNLIDARSFFAIISPLFGNLPQHMLRMQITLDFSSDSPVTVEAEFLADIDKRGEILSFDVSREVFDLVRKESELAPQSAANSSITIDHTGRLSK